MTPFIEWLIIVGWLVGARIDVKADAVLIHLDQGVIGCPLVAGARAVT